MMVTKAKVSAPAAKRPAPRKRAAPAVEPAAEATPATEATKPANPLRAGPQAFDKARPAVAERQSRVFQAIIGSKPPQSLA